MIIAKPPEILPDIFSHKKLILFLAGSIEMGSATNWQTKISEKLNDLDIVICNPRRDSWDSSWKQDISNSNFRTQVEWELTHIENANLIIFYFDPNTKSPITLLELGLTANSTTECIVCCPPGYWRRGNIQIVCNRYNILLLDTFDELVLETRKKLKSFSTITNILKRYTNI